MKQPPRTKRASSRPRRVRRFAICVDNAGYDVSLERWKVYEVLPEPNNAGGELMRVVDESGEDYLYPTSMFHPIELPEAVRHRYIDEVAEPSA